MKQTLGPWQAWGRHDTLMVVSLLVLAALIRLPHLISPYVINIDAINYIDGAKALLREETGFGVVLSRGSVYPLLIAMSYPIFGDWVIAARLLPVVFGIITVFSFYLLVRQLLDRKLAWFPVTLYALSPAILRPSVDVIRDPLLWFGFTLFVWMLLKAVRDNRWRQYLCCGVIALWCIFVRAESLVFLCTGALIALWAGLLSGSIRKALGNTSFLLLPVVIIALSMAVLRPGSWKVAASQFAPYMRQAHSFLKGGPAGAKQEVQEMISKTKRPRVARFFSTAWEKRWVLMGWDLLEHWIKTSHPTAFVLMLFGMARTECRRDNRWRVLLFLMAALFCIGYVRISAAFAISKRHLVPLVLLGYVFAAKGFEALVEFSTKRWPAVGYRPTAAALASAVALVMLVKDLEPIRTEKLIRRQAGEWIRALGIPHPTIVTRHRHIAFYAEGRSVAIEEFIKDPSAEAQFLAWGTEEERLSNALQRLKASGWEASFLKEFSDERGSVFVYALTRSRTATR